MDGYVEFVFSVPKNVSFLNFDALKLWECFSIDHPFRIKWAAFIFKTHFENRIWRGFLNVAVRNKSFFLILEFPKLKSFRTSTEFRWRFWDPKFKYLPDFQKSFLLKAHMEISFRLESNWQFIFVHVHERLKNVSAGFVWRLNVFDGQCKAKKLDPIVNTFSLTFKGAQIMKNPRSDTLSNFFHAELDGRKFTHTHIFQFGILCRTYFRWLSLMLTTCETRFRLETRFL